MQSKSDHPLARFGYSPPPHWLWRKSRKAYAVVGAFKDIWLIATGRLNLHRAWQQGYDDRSAQVFTADTETPKIRQKV